MNSVVNNICLVEYCPIADIESITDNKVSPAVVSAPWQTLDCAPGALLSISESFEKPGREFVTSLNCTMRTKLLNNNLLIVRITTDDGTQLLIGDPDLPVRFQEDHAITSKSLTFSHSSWHYPYPVTDASAGSDSGSSGI